MAVKKVITCDRCGLVIEEYNEASSRDATLMITWHGKDESYSDACRPCQKLLHEVHRAFFSGERIDVPALDDSIDPKRCVEV